MSLRLKCINLNNFSTPRNTSGVTRIPNYVYIIIFAGIRYTQNAVRIRFYRNKYLHESVLERL